MREGRTQKGCQLAFGLARGDGTGALGRRRRHQARFPQQQREPSAHENVRGLTAFGEVTHQTAKGGDVAVLTHAQGVGQQPLGPKERGEAAGEKSFGEDVVATPGHPRRGDVVDGNADLPDGAQRVERVEGGVGVPRVRMVPVGDPQVGARQTGSSISR